MSFIYGAPTTYKYGPLDVNYLDLLDGENDNNSDWWLRQAIMMIYGKPTNRSLYSVILERLSGHTKSVLERFDAVHPGILFKIYIEAMEAIEHLENIEVTKSIKQLSVSIPPEERFRIYNEQARASLDNQQMQREMRTKFYVDANAIPLRHRWLLNLAVCVSSNQKPKDKGDQKIAELMDIRLAMYRPVNRLFQLKEALLLGQTEREPVYRTLLKLIKENRFQILGLSLAHIKKSEGLFEQLDHVVDHESLATLKNSFKGFVTSSLYDEKVRKLKSDPLYSEVNFDMLSALSEENDIKKIFNEEAKKVKPSFDFDTSLLWDVNNDRDAMACIQAEFCRVMKQKALRNDVNAGIYDLWNETEPSEFIEALSQTPNELIITSAASITTGDGNRGIIGALCEKIDHFLATIDLESLLKNLPNLLRRFLPKQELQGPSIPSSCSLNKEEAIAYLIHKVVSETYGMIAMLVSFRQYTLSDCRIIPVPKVDPNKAALMSRLSRMPQKNAGDESDGPSSEPNSPTIKSSPRERGIKFADGEGSVLETSSGKLPHISSPRPSRTPRFRMTGNSLKEQIYVPLEPKERWLEWIREFNVYVNDTSAETRSSIWIHVTHYAEHCKLLDIRLTCLIALLELGLGLTTKNVEPFFKDKNQCEQKEEPSWERLCLELREDLNYIKEIWSNLEKLLAHNPEASNTCMLSNGM